MDQGEIHEEHTWAFVAQKALLILAWKTNVTTSSLRSCKHGFASERKCCNLRTPTVACSDIKPVDYDYMTGLKIHQSEMFGNFGIVKYTVVLYPKSIPVIPVTPRHGVLIIPPDSCRLYGWHRHPISGCRSPTSSEILRSKQDIDR